LIEDRRRRTDGTAGRTGSDAHVHRRGLRRLGAGGRAI